MIEERRPAATRACRRARTKRACRRRRRGRAKAVEETNMSMEETSGERERGRAGWAFPLSDPTGSKPFPAVLCLSMISQRKEAGRRAPDPLIPLGETARSSQRTIDEAGRPGS